MQLKKLKNKQIENAEVLFDIDNTIFISQKDYHANNHFKGYKLLMMEK